MLAWTGLPGLSARLAAQLIPLGAASTGAGFRLMLTHGVLAVPGMAMICPVFVPARWRSGGDGVLAPGSPAPIRLLS